MNLVTSKYLYFPSALRLMVRVLRERVLVLAALSLARVLMFSETWLYYDTEHALQRGK
jgi:hypothetical protein